MEFWIEREQCTACGACANTCSANAIQLLWDETGCSYPVIEHAACVDCGQCRLSCPVYRGQNDLPDSVLPKRSAPSVYAAWSRTYKTRYNSTSGGVFSELARAALREGAYIAGAAYDDDQMVHHILGNTEDVLEQLRQSKYVQSDIGLLFRDVRALLAQGERVLFCGTPCQVAGLYGFLGGEHENLITVDFICRGNNAPMVYRAWLDDLEQEYGAKATKITFKDKEHGWKNFSTRVDFSNGSCYCKTRNEDLFMRGYLKYNLFIRQSCTQCPFKGVPRKGDITLADFWGVRKELDSDLGTSLVLVSSDKGEALFDRSRAQLVVHEQTYEDALKGNPCLVDSVAHGEKREEFFSYLKEGKSFSQAFRIVAEETDPLVSVIVPVNSASQYLEKSIDSVLEQGYKQLELLLICGCADKALQNAVAQIAARRPAVRLLPPVGDITHAIDVAVIEAKGTYIHILSGREELYPDLYRSIIAQMEEKHAGIACFGWANAQQRDMCRNAFCGTGNTRALLDLLLTQPGAESDYTGYGGHLWNKIFRKDTLVVGDEPIRVPMYGFAMTELFWQIRLAFHCDTALFLPATMMNRFVMLCPFEQEFSPQNSLREFFDLETQTLQLLETEPRAYDAAKRIFSEYELSLLFFCRQQNMRKTESALLERLTVFHEIAMDSQQTLDARMHTLALEQSAAASAKKITKLEKDIISLRSQKSELDASCALLQENAAQREQDLCVLQNEKTRLEQKCAALEEETGQKEKCRLDLETCCADLQENVAELEKDRAFLKNKAARLEKDRAFLEANCASLRENVEKRETAICSLQDEKSSLEKKCAALDSKVVQQEKYCHRLENDCASLRENADELESALCSLQDEKNVLEKECAVLNSKAEEWEKQCLRLENNCLFLQNNATCLEKELGALRDEKDALENDIVALQECIAGLEKDRKFLKNKVTSLEKDRTFLKEKSRRLSLVAEEYQGAVLACIGLKIHRLFRRAKGFLRAKTARLIRKNK